MIYLQCATARITRSNPIRRIYNVYTVSSADFGIYSGYIHA